MSASPEIVSLLPQLEPTLGAALAINTAYLSFARFRYRSKIRDHARNELSKIENGDHKPTEATKGTEYYQRIAQLALLEDHDDDLPKKDSKAKLPSGWAWFYAHLFQKHTDRRICWFFVVLTALLLVLGVAQNASLADWSLFLFSKQLIAISFVISLLCIIVPLAMIWLGSKVVKALTHYCSGEARALAEFMRAQIPDRHDALQRRIQEARRTHLNPDRRY